MSVPPRGRRGPRALLPLTILSLPILGACGASTVEVPGVTMQRLTPVQVVQ